MEVERDGRCALCERRKEEGRPVLTFQFEPRSNLRKLHILMRTLHEHMMSIE